MCSPTSTRRESREKTGRAAASPALARLERLVDELRVPPVTLSALNELLGRLTVITADLAQQYQANPHEERTAWARRLTCKPANAWKSCTTWRRG